MIGSAMMPLAMSQAGMFGAGLDPRKLREAMALAGHGGLPNNNPGAATHGPVSPTSVPPMDSAMTDRPQPLASSPVSAPVDQFQMGAQLGAAAQPNYKKSGGMFGAGFGAKVLPMIVAGLNGYLAGRGNPVGMMNLQAAQRDKERQADFMQRIQELQMRQMLPQSVGGSLVQLGKDGQYHTLYDAPQAFEKYAEALGFTPGTPEYQAAVQDYKLGSWSDPAMQARTALEGTRFGYRQDLQDDRLDVTRRGQDLNHSDRQAAIAQSNTNNIRTTGTSAANNRRTTATSAANAGMRDATTRGAYSYSHGGGRGGKAGSSEIAEGTIINNPSTGQRMVRKGGQWVPIK